MEPRVAFLADLTVALAAATIGGWIAARLRLHPILGYLAAGIAIGPFTPGYVARADTLDTLATLGLIFLLFSLGLGFSFTEVRALGARAVGGNVAAMALAALAGAAAARVAGFPHPLTIALVVAVSSTAVGTALLRRWDLDADRAGRYAFAQLVVQDLLSVALLVVVTAPAGALSPAGIAAPVLRAIAFVAVALVLGATLLHRAVRALVGSATPDTLAAAFAALALVAAWLGYLAGLSFEFGAFVAGAVISEAAGSRIVASVVAPFRAVFIAFFFVSTGMLLDPHVFVTAWAPIAGLVAALLVARIAGWTLLAAGAAIPLGRALLVAIAMTSLGEFNVVLLDEAWRAHRLDGTERHVLLAVTVVSIVAAVAFAEPAARLRRIGRAAPPSGEPRDVPVAIVGLGRVGTTVAAALEAAGIRYAALERDPAAVRAARAGAVVLGDAVDPRALARVVGASTRLVLVTVPDRADANAVVQRLGARAGTRIVARAADVRHAEELTALGAAAALVPEIEGARRFAELAVREAPG